MKKYLLGAIALVTAITLNSFTVKSHSHPSTIKNFVYLDYPNDANKNISSRYQLTGNDGTDDLPCPGGAHRCGVEAVDNGSGHPDLTQPFTPRTLD